MTLRALPSASACGSKGGAFALFLFPSACALGYCLSPRRGFCESRSKEWPASKEEGALLVHGMKR